MQYAVSSKAPSTINTDCLILLLDDELSLLPANWPAASQQQLAAQIKAGDFTGKREQTLLLRDSAINAQRLLLVGCGKLPLSAGAALQLLASASRAVADTGSKQAALYLPTDLLQSDDPLWLVREGVRVIDQAHYRFDEFRSKPEPAAPLRKLTLLSESESKAAKQALREGQAIAAGVKLARDLGNRPPNLCHPHHLVEQAQALAKTYPALELTVLNEKQAEKLGMGAFCAVARGSEHDGQIIAMHYNGLKHNGNKTKGSKGKAGKDAPLALVGKGITFDTGGISLKPGAGMDEMKYDMCGAASVFGVVRAICELAPPINLVAVVVAAENMPDGRASRPGDIVKTLSGQTVEILNTDAEGRLVLCDALTWTQRKFKPRSVVDIATLTGACVMALGAHAQAVYSNNDALRDALLRAGEQSHDRGWPMPLWDDYQEQLDSPFADMANIGGPKAGSVTAACFLSRFARDLPWAHLDIAGTAWISNGKKKGATGRPVPMLMRYLLDAEKP